jgi:hypothetical protein
MLRRQVLQIGIMLHSLVIGITLAITSGSEFSESRPEKHAQMLT